jgi:hypothetical protein
MKKCKLKGNDIILNLKKVYIGPISEYGVSSCSGSAIFCFANTKHGCVETPDMKGLIRVLKAEKKKGYYFFKIKFKKEKEDDD